MVVKEVDDEEEVEVGGFVVGVGEKMWWPEIGVPCRSRGGRRRRGGAVVTKGEEEEEVKRSEEK